MGYDPRYYEELKKHAVDSITTGKIINQHKWDVWCNILKRGALSKKYPFSKEFTNEIIFTMLLKECFYCGQLATTIDRRNSTIAHTPDNCVGSCWGCNCSKGASDSATFIRKAYYRARGKYVDNITDIWFVNNNKPTMSNYKRVEKKGIPYDLTKEDFNTMIKGECAYCHRSPTTWFGIDRVIPENGYVFGNVVTCCYDCNLDKHVANVDLAMKRNERIAERVETGKLIIEDCQKVVIHRGVQKTSKKVCVYGKVYTSKREASRALGKSDCYVNVCIRGGIHSDDIFVVDDDV